MQCRLVPTAAVGNSIETTDANAGEFVADNTLAFHVSRTGPTTTGLAVQIAATGSSTAGDDFTGFTCPLEIPAGASFADKPTQQFHHTSIANAALLGPPDDADGDGSSNFLEYYFGSQLDDASSTGQMQSASANGAISSRPPSRGRRTGPT
jgi:hypothetical protein